MKHSEINQSTSCRISHCYQILATLTKVNIMGRNSSVYLGHHFETFIEEKINTGRYQNASEVILAGLRLLEEEEDRFAVLSNAIAEGMDNGVASEFDPQKHLQNLKATRKGNDQLLPEQ